MKLSTTTLARSVLAAVASVLLAAGCGADSGAEASGAGGTSGSLVSLASVDGAEVLVDDEGRTLYTADVEKGGEIRCVDACTAFWAPVTASAADVDEAGAEVRDELAVVERPDGDSQLTYQGLPLYTFTEEEPGELQGDGFTDVFQGTHFVWLAATTGESSGSSGSDAPAAPGGGYDY